MAAPRRVDLRNCADEPIHIPVTGGEPALGQRIVRRSTA
jgi:hypothetical protein